MPYNIANYLMRSQSKRYITIVDILEVEVGCQYFF